MDLLKIFKRKKEDDIPKVVLPENEPKSYFDKTLGVWMFEGEEEEIKKNLAKKNLPPPKKENNSSTTRNAGSGDKKKKGGAVKRYANILGEENIIESNPVQGGQVVERSVIQKETMTYLKNVISLLTLY